MKVFFLVVLCSVAVLSYIYSGDLYCDSERDDCQRYCDEEFTGSVPDEPSQTTYNFCYEGDVTNGIGTCYFVPGTGEEYDKTRYTLALTTECDVGTRCVDENCPSENLACCLAPLPEKIMLYDLYFCSEECDGEPAHTTFHGRGDSNCLDTEEGSRDYLCDEEKGLIKRLYNSTNCSGDFSEDYTETYNCDLNGGYYTKTLCSHEIIKEADVSTYASQTDCSNEENAVTQTWFGEGCLVEGCVDECCENGDGGYREYKCVTDTHKVAYDYDDDKCTKNGEEKPMNYYLYEQCYDQYQDENWIYYKGKCEGSAPDEDDSNQDDDKDDNNNPDASSITVACVFLIVVTFFLVL